MRLSQLTMNAAVFVTAALVASVVAWAAVVGIERSAKRELDSRFRLEGVEWAGVRTDGLQVFLSGSAVTETERFRAISIAGTVIDAARVVDQIEVPPPDPILAPRFSVEILRNDRGVSLIGLIPAATDRETITGAIQEVVGDVPVTDLLESADYPEPENWEMALSYGLDALATLPRSKVSVAAGEVAVTAIAESRVRKRELETSLVRNAPEGVSVSLNITAPRPVITPFTLRFLKDESGARFDACSAHTEEGRETIIAAARAAGLEGKVSCTLGLGVPSADWPDAVASAIAALDALGGGSVTFSDADITFIALDTTPQSAFDRITGELEAALPDVYSLHAVLPEPVHIDGTGEANAGPPEFIATLSPEGQVQLRGRVTDDRLRSAAESYAASRFGVGSITATMRLDENLPIGWSPRVLAALEALSYLTNGAVVVQPDVVDISGSTGDPDANAEISRILSEKLGEAQDFRVNVNYIEALDPIASLPSPEECVAQINAVLNARKITFDPGSADIVADARRTVDEIAEIVKTCPDVPMEIAGYTDSQGREEMNKALSQTRAQAVLNALLARRVLTSNLTAVGYGEESPIADNGTEEGREANRRIEFSLIVPEQTQQDEAGGQAEDAAASGETGEDNEQN